MVAVDEDDQNEADDSGKYKTGHCKIFTPNAFLKGLETVIAVSAIPIWEVLSCSDATLLGPETAKPLKQTI